MRILMFNNEFPPLGGGTGVVNARFLKELVHYEDIAVDLVTASPFVREKRTERHNERITIYYVPVGTRNPHHARSSELIRYMHEAYAAGAELHRRQPYDMSFAWAGVPAGCISYLLYRRTKLPYLAALRGPDIPGFETRYRYLYPLLRPLLRRVWRSASAVTVTSRENLHLSHKTLPSLQTEIIPNGIDTAVFTPAETPRNATISLLCVGRLIERKGQRYLLEAVAQLRSRSATPFTLNLVGTGDDERALRRLAEHLGITDIVNFSGYVPHEKMPDIYQKSDIFLLPSEHEGMSNALLEAMACGLPVIVTDTGGTEELVRAGENGLVVPWGDVTALADALQQLLKSTEIRKSMGRKSGKIAEGLRWSAMTERYVQLCRAISAVER